MNAAARVRVSAMKKYLSCICGSKNGMAIEKTKAAPNRLRFVRGFRVSSKMQMTATTVKAATMPIFPAKSTFGTDGISENTEGEL